jgi:hypothetical protein
VWWTLLISIRGHVPLNCVKLMPPIDDDDDDCVATRYLILDDDDGVMTSACRRFGDGVDRRQPVAALLHQSTAREMGSDECAPHEQAPCFLERAAPGPP